MANVTHLPKGSGVDDLIGFDTGPGNALLDALVAMISPGESFDEDGRRARRGRVADALLEELLADPFFAQPPPRSTGRERFGAPYATALRARGESLRLSDDDILATAVALTAESVARAVREHLAPRGVDAVYASGGGVRNATLMQALRATSPRRPAPRIPSCSGT
jgi:anhydro-N-acetylmuramic acid kinase